MKRTGNGLHVVLGVVAGLVWFATLSGTAVAHEDLVATGSSTVGTLALAAVVSALCTLGFMVWRASWGVGVSAAMAACLLLGLIEGPLPTSLAPSQLLSIPATFSVGLGNLAVWVAFAVSVTLTVATARRGLPAQQASPRVRESI